jgi:SMI1 / KNR4 family (SUKH-1)
MKKLQVQRAGDLPSEKDLKTFEIENKIKLPDLFKYFLLTQNAYLVTEKSFKKKGRETYQIHHFYPFDLKIELSFQFCFENLKDFFDNKYIPFANDAGGWQYVISIREENYGRVYFCRMDEELDDALTLVADNFELFISGLY